MPFKSQILRYLLDTIQYMLESSFGLKQCPRKCIIITILTIKSVLTNKSST